MKFKEKMKTKDGWPEETNECVKRRREWRNLWNGRRSFCGSV